MQENRRACLSFYTRVSNFENSVSNLHVKTIGFIMCSQYSGNYTRVSICSDARVYFNNRVSNCNVQNAVFSICF